MPHATLSRLCSNVCIKDIPKEILERLEIVEGPLI